MTNENKNVIVFIGSQMKTTYGRRQAMYETSKLRGRIIEKFGTLGNFATEAHVSMSFLSQYMNGKKKLDQPTISKWAALLELEDKDIPAYFFTRVVHENELSAV